MATRDHAVLERIAALDPALGAEARAAFDRLRTATAAVAWANERLALLLGSPGPGGALRVVVDEARALTGAPEVWALRLARGEPGRVVALARGGDGATIPPPREVSRSIVGDVLRTGRPAWSDDAAADARFLASVSVQGMSLRSVGCVPIGARAALYLVDPNEPGRFSTGDRLRLGALCALAGKVIDASPTPPAPAEAIAGIIGQSPQMRELFTAVRAFAPMPWPVLVLGETGTGKELVARSLHALSPRAEAPMVAINCGAIPEELAESTLFGHERGAFTGADRRHEGVCERVGGGTLFLDEVGELSARAQVKLLRLLEDSTFERVGGREPIRFRGRIVAATLRPIDDPAERSGFRDDLFHRLAGCVIEVPPLRARRCDIPALAQHLLEGSLAELPTPVDLALGADAIATLSLRPWPGNVRELRNALRGAIARAVAAGDATIHPTHFGAGAAIAAPAGAGDLDVSDLQAATEAFQQRVVRAAIDACEGNRTQAAARLGVSRQWLHRLLARWGDPDEG
jgi:two-component system, NtrC family, response regulator AtoC